MNTKIKDQKKSRQKPDIMAEKETDQTMEQGNGKNHITGAQVLLDSLIAEGVDTIFGYPGGAIMPVYDKLMDYEDRLTHILTRHEQGAAHAAQAYTMAKGKPGVCFARKSVSTVLSSFNGRI